VAEIVNVAVIIAGFTAVTALTVTPVPETATVVPAVVKLLPVTATSKLFFEEVAAVGIYEFLCRAVLSLPCVSAYALETIQGNRVDVAKIGVGIISGAKHMPIPDRAVNDCCLFQPTNLVP